MTHKLKAQNTETPVNNHLKQEQQLQWLVLLLTGDEGVRIEAPTGALDVNHAASPGDRWMAAWARKLVISRALLTVKSQIRASTERYMKLPDVMVGRPGRLPPPSWSAAQEVTETHLQRALLAIDVFPRCALILTVFEGMQVEDVASLLGADEKRVKSAEVAGLIELSQNIALEQGWRPAEIAVPTYIGRAGANQ